MSNEYFKLLLSEKWTPKKTHKGKPWTGPLQYEDPSGELMMTPADKKKYTHTINPLPHRHHQKETRVVSTRRPSRRALRGTAPPQPYVFSFFAFAAALLLLFFLLLLSLWLLLRVPYTCACPSASLFDPFPLPCLL